MSTSSINNLGGDLPPVLAAPLHASSDTTGNIQAGTDSPSGRFKPDISQLSPYGELHVLQRLLQSDQAKYQQITDQIALNLKTAADAAQSNGGPASCPARGRRFW